MPRNTRNDQNNADELNEAADRLAAQGNLQGAENLRGIADAFRTTRPGVPTAADELRERQAGARKR